MGTISGELSRWCGRLRRCLRDPAPFGAGAELRFVSRGNGARAALSRGVAACAVLLSCSAQAQWSAQVGAASDYVYRGVSLNDDRPAAMAAVNYDSAAGWYLGAQVGETRLYGERHTEPLWIADVGYAHALTSQLSWEIGVTYSVFSHFTFWNYAETFVGLSAENWSLRLYHAPDYFGRGRHSTYLEFNAMHPLDERWRLLGHVGMQQAVAQVGDHGRTFDTSVGLGAKFDRVDLQLLWIATSRANYLYPSLSPEDRRRWVLSAAYAF
jgi:uncharacterized protein (TIGR02001 family)